MCHFSLHVLLHRLALNHIWFARVYGQIKVNTTEYFFCIHNQPAALNP